MSIDFTIDDQAFAHGQVSGSGDIRCQLADFIVEEQLGFELSGSGEHLCLWIEKQGHNTAFVAQQLAQFTQLPLRKISYCGMKDRHAITRQWFCLPLGIKSSLNIGAFQYPGIKIIETKRHLKKLRIGVHNYNRFIITIRNLATHNGNLHKIIEQRIKQIKQYGVPNYFGPQRFGRQGQNLDLVKRLFAGEKIANRKHKSIILSASRSYLFNQLLSARIKQVGFGDPVDGDVFRLDGCQSLFVSEVNQQILHRLQRRDLHLTLPLPGSNQCLNNLKSLTFQQQILQHYSNWLSALDCYNLSMTYRDKILLPVNFNHAWLEGDDHQLSSLQLQFTLAKGGFATSILRELLDFKDKAIG